MKRIEVLAEKFKDVKQVRYLEAMIYLRMNFIKSIRGDEFIYTPDFFRKSFGNQVEDFRVGLEVKKDPINTLLDGSVIDYNRSNEENAKLIVSSWNRSVEMYPIAKIGDKNYSKLATLSIFSLIFIKD